MNISALTASAPILEHVTWPCVPYSDESLIGFISRSADRNAIRHMRVILGDAGFPPHQKFGPVSNLTTHTNDLARILKADPAWLRNAACPQIGADARRIRYFYDFAGASLRSCHLDFETRRLAPAALRLAEYHRRIWHIATLPACSETWTLLIQTCPRCASPLDWRNAHGIGRCSEITCRRSFLDHSTRPIPKRFRKNLGLAADLLDPDDAKNLVALENLPRSFRNHNRGCIFEFIWSVGCLFEPNFGEALSKPNDLPPIARAEIICRGVDMLLDWPERFRKKLKDSVQTDAHQLSFRLSRIHHSRTPHGNLGEFLNTAINIGMNRSFSKAAFESLGYVTTDVVRQAAAQGQGLVDRLKNCRELGYFEANGFGLFPKNAIGKIRRARAELLPPRKLANQIGISCVAVHELIRRRTLKRTGNSIAWTLNEWKVTLDLHTAQRLFHNLDKRIPLANAPTDAVPLRVAFRGFPGPIKPWADVVIQLLEGNLCAYRVTSALNLRECLVSVSQLREAIKPTFRRLPDWLEMPEWISELEAREMLSCGRRHLQMLVLENLVKASGKFSGQTYSLNDVISFGTCYVSSVELNAVVKFYGLDRAGQNLKRKHARACTNGFFHRGMAFNNLGLHVDGY